MNLVYFGSYKPEYPRNRILLDGLRANGVSVVECNEPGTSRLRYLKLAWRLLRLRGAYAAVIVAFPGQETVFIARLCASAPVVLDVFTSHYMGYVLDRKRVSAGSFKARWYRFLDRWSCMLADVVLLDTDAHIQYFVEEFGLPRRKFIRSLLGADGRRFHDAGPLPPGPLRVLFWGNFIPLQGADVIVQAAALLKKEDIRFTLVGNGQTLADTKALAAHLGVHTVEFPGKLDDAALGERIRLSHVCLGAFGSGKKTDITIQNKIYESLASRRTLVSARTTAIREVLSDGAHALLCRAGDAQDVADTLRKLSRDMSLCQAVADAGYGLFRSTLATEHIGEQLVRDLTSRIS